MSPRKPLTVRVPPELVRAAEPASRQTGEAVNPRTGVPLEGRRVLPSGKRKKTFHVPDDLCAALRAHCAECDTDESAVVVAALRKHLGRSR